MNKKLLSTGLGLGLLAGSGAGLVWQVAGPAGAISPAVTDPTDTTVADTTDSAADTTDAGQPGDRWREVLQPLVADGTLTQAQLDTVIDTMVAAHPEGGRGGGRGHGGRGMGLATVAETLGLDEAAVRQAIADGQTIADLAAANGSSAQAVIDALVAATSARLDAKVADGSLTQAEADTKLAERTTEITEFVNNTPTQAADRGRHGRDGASTDSTTETLPTES